MGFVEQPGGAASLRLESMLCTAGSAAAMGGVLHEECLRRRYTKVCKQGGLRELRLGLSESRLMTILLQLQSTVDVAKKCLALRSLRWSNLEGCMFEDYTQSGYAGAGRNWGIFVEIP